MRQLAVLGLVVGVALGTASPARSIAPGAVVVSHGSRAAAEVALTFDDAISPANCRRILAILVGRHVPATFFPAAALMPEDPAFWRLVVASGDPIGDHTLTHPQMPSLTAAAQLGQIWNARLEVESISGAPILPVFRPPYGAYDEATLAAAGDAGFPTVLLWDTSDRDTSTRGTMAEMLSAAEGAVNGSVILLHCGPNATPYLLGPLIDELRSRGLRPVTVPVLLGLRWQPTATGQPPTPATILAGLSPLPASPSGGPIIGPNGIGSTSAPTAVPSPAASAVGSGPAPSGAGSPVPGSPAPSPPATASGAVGASVSPGPGGLPGGNATGAGPGNLAALLVVLALALGAVVLVGVVRAARAQALGRRARRRGSGTDAAWRPRTDSNRRRQP